MTNVAEEIEKINQIKKVSIKAREMRQIKEGDEMERGGREECMSQYLEKAKQLTFDVWLRPFLFKLIFVYYLLFVRLHN